jgi:GNAT superfamily N-acetyltransferase
VLVGALKHGGEAFAPLTYPRFVPCLADPGPQVVAIGAVAGDCAIGLALARLGDDGAARLLSLNVDPAWRGRGIGNALLTACEGILQKRGATRIVATHSSRTVERIAFERMLAAAGWAPTVLCGLRVVTHCGAGVEAGAAVPVLRRQRLLEGGYRFTPWSEFDERDREAVARLSEQPPCQRSPALTPRGWPPEIEPATSLAIRCDRDLVGWIISERQPDGSIHYRAAYLDMALWRSALVVAAYCDALARQAEAFGPMSLARFETSVELNGMIALIRRRIAPFAVSVDEILGTCKTIVPAIPPQERPA